MSTSCGDCGKEVQDGDRFCAHCGAPQRAAASDIESGPTSVSPAEGPALTEAAPGLSARPGAGWAAASQGAQIEFNIPTRTNIVVAGKPLEPLSIPASLWLRPDARASYGEQPLITMRESA